MAVQTVLLVSLAEEMNGLKSRLEETGVCVVHYEDAIGAAIGLIKITPAAAVVGLPAYGMELVDILHAIQKSNPKARIAVVAEQYSRSEEVAARELGVVFFGIRPVEESLLLEIVQSALAVNGRRRQTNGEKG